MAKDGVRSIEGTITLTDGTTSTFRILSIAGDPAWFQGGDADRERLSRTVDVMDSMQEAVAGYLVDDRDDDEDDDEDDEPRSGYYDTRLTDEQVDTVVKEWEQEIVEGAPSWPNLQSFVSARHPGWITSAGLDMGTVLRIQNKLGRNYGPGEEV